MSKITKNERISTLEDAVAMNWSDMKKIETKISRAMTDMATRISNISLQLEGQQRQIHLAADSIGLNKQAIIMLENKAEPKPLLKQLDQSVFNGLDEKWRFAAVDKCGEVWYSTHKTQPSVSGTHLSPEPNANSMQAEGYYDTSNWQNSLIERSTAKELTGSDLARAPSEFKDGDLVFELDFSYGIKLVSLKKAGRLAQEDYSFQTRYGFNYLKDGRAYPMFSVPHLIHATKENRKALVTLYGEKSVPQLPSEVGL